MKMFKIHLMSFALICGLYILKKNDTNDQKNAPLPLNGGGASMGEDNRDGGENESERNVIHFAAIIQQKDGTQEKRK